MLGRHSLGALCVLALTMSAATAQVGVGPLQSPATAPIEPPRDRPFPGAITLAVDATDVAHRIYVVHETIPARGGHALTLLYPQWETGSHAATASAAALAGLRIQAGDRMLGWRRDPVNVFAFHVDVPRGAASVEVDFQFLSPVSARVGALTMTHDVVTVPWPSVLVYPAGWYARDILVNANANANANVRLPAGLHAATALESLQAGEESDSGELRFATTSLERLADSPLYAGRHFRREELAATGETPVHLDLFAEDSASLVGGEAQIDAMRRLVHQTQVLFGVRHFVHYDFLTVLGESFPGPAASSTLNRTRTSCRRISSHIRTPNWSTPICWRTSSRIRGTDASGNPPICGQPTPSHPKQQCPPPRHPRTTGANTRTCCSTR